MIEAKPQPKINSNGPFNDTFPSHYANDGNDFF